MQAWRIVVALGGLGCALGCAEEKTGSGPSHIELPEVYPKVRAATPTSLITDARYMGGSTAPLSPRSSSTSLGQARQAQAAALGLGTAVQERFYSGGPTSLLRIVKDLDDRVSPLDTDPSKHECLTSTPVPWTYTLPAGQTFSVKLQCLQELGGPGTGGGWVAFGFDQVSAADAGRVEASAGNDFYLVQGQSGGMGGAYHVSGDTGDVEGWLAVADQASPNNSQVIMHLLTDEANHTLELTLAGSGVGFCSAHLKTSSTHLFVRGKTNGAPAPGTPIAAGSQYCDAQRSGCFDTTAVATDLGADAAGCSAIAASTFDIGLELDASSDAGANVTPSTLYTHFNTPPSGVPAF